MKKLLSIIFIIGFLGMGCSSVKVTFDPATGFITYERSGDQEIAGFVAEKPDGFKVQFEGQRSQNAALIEAIRLIGILSVPK